MKQWAGKIVVPAVIVGLAAVQSFGIGTGSISRYSRQSELAAKELREELAESKLIKSIVDTTGAEAAGLAADLAALEAADSAAAQAAEGLDSAALAALDSAALAAQKPQPEPRKDTIVTIHDTVLVLLSAIYTPQDTTITSRDTVYTLTDSVITLKDRTTINVRERVRTLRDTTYKTRNELRTLYDTTFTTKDTLITLRDTTYVPKDTLVTVQDTTYTPKDTLITVNDTTYTTRDTLMIVADTVYVKRDSLDIVRGEVITLREPKIRQKEALVAVLDEHIAQRDTIITIQLPVVTQRDTIIQIPEPRITKRDTLMTVPDTILTPHDTLMTITEPRITAKDRLEFFRDSIPPVLTARDTIIPPDSLRETDPFKYKYYVAIKDRPTHDEVRHSILNAGDSLELVMFDSLYVKDSTETAKAEFAVWYASLTKKERKKYDYQQEYPIRLAEVNAKLARQDSLKAIKDSIIENTPRILETYAVPDSMQYKRIIRWKHTREFNDVNLEEIDTSYNYHFHDQAPYKEDLNVVSTGVSGGATMPYDFSKRKRTDAFFYDNFMVYSYTPGSLPMYNSKTPHTELAYWGTLFANSEKEESNIRVFTTQNITPALNVTLEYDRNGSEGMLQNESTDNRTFVFSTNYLGRRYLMHAGYIFNRVKRTENGGIIDNYWIRDTVVDGKEIDVALSDANSVIRQNTLFLDQSYRIPLEFIKKIGDGHVRERKAREARRDSILATGDTALIASYLASEEERIAKEAEEIMAADTLDRDVTTAFIGHSSEYSVYTRNYYDAISSSDTTAQHLFNDNFYINPTETADSMRVMKFDNKVYIRLQPWKEDAIVSKLDVGIGDKLMNYYDYDPSNYLKTKNNTSQNSVYLYAGVKGQYRNIFKWNASGDYTFLGHEINDFGINANLEFNAYPFRKARKSPLSITAHFETSMRTPDHYMQTLYTNHYKWNNNFDKISTTKIEGKVSIPYWKLEANVSYSLLKNYIYYGSDGIVRQNGSAMSVLSASLMKNFTALKVFHFDHRVLFQVSSDEDVVPVPDFTAAIRYYIQFDVVKNVMQMQLGAEARWNTEWYLPGYNPALGVFYNQKETKYGGDSPYIDAFVNMQWKRACIFVKVVNVGEGWPSDRPDYFSAHHYINPQRVLKFGIFWPFYMQPAKNTGAAARAAAQGPSGSPAGERSAGGRNLRSAQ